MPLHLIDDKHKYCPEVGEKVYAVFKNQSVYRGHEFLDIIVGTNHGRDPIYWKEGYTITDQTGREDICSPGLLYPLSFTINEVRESVAERLRSCVFMTKPEDRSTRSKLDEKCVMCANRETYWAVSTAVFLSRDSRQWHLHVDCLHHILPRRQFGLKVVDSVEYDD